MLGGGTNGANASLSGNGEALHFPDLGGAGSDALIGSMPPSSVGVAVDGNGSSDPATNGHALLDASTDDPAVHINSNDPHSIADVNHQTVA